MPGHPQRKAPQESMAYTHLSSNHPARETAAQNALGYTSHTHLYPASAPTIQPGAIPGQPTLHLRQFQESYQDTSVQRISDHPQPLPTSASVILLECLCIKNPRTPCASSHFSFNCPDSTHSMQGALGPPCPMPNSAADIPPGQCQHRVPQDP